MEFRTSIKVNKIEEPIKHSDELMLIGSCCSDNVGARFADAMMNVMVNPLGTVYNPLSIASAVSRIVECHKVQAEELFEANGWRTESFTVSPWDGSVQAYYFIKDESDIHLEFACNTLTICFNYENGIDAVSGVSADIMIPVQYVHQLQQVLRLAGMTELANNFKI